MMVVLNSKLSIPAFKRKCLGYLAGKATQLAGFTQLKEKFITCQNPDLAGLQGQTSPGATPKESRSYRKGQAR